MPELPEVETTRRGIAAHILGEKIKQVLVRDRRLRWPVISSLEDDLKGKTIRKIWRRGKYLVLDVEDCHVLLHLGMSGSLRILYDKHVPGKHDHVDILFNKGHTLRFRDPRRFGSIHLTHDSPLEHPLLKSLGPEPLSDDLNADYLYQRSRKRSQSIKSFIMDSHTVVGIGNIYANEALFRAGIHPLRQAGRISSQRYEKLVVAIKSVLQKALKKGGTTLRDFVNGSGEPGYFRHELQVYERGDLACFKCNCPIKTIRIGQRASYYCKHCQT